MKMPYKVAAAIRQQLKNLVRDKLEVLGGFARAGDPEVVNSVNRGWAIEEHTDAVDAFWDFTHFNPEYWTNQGELTQAAKTALLELAKEDK